MATAKKPAKKPAKKAAPARKKMPKGPYEIDIWDERDRLVISVDDASGKTIARWADEDARDMFESGFFKSGRKLGESVIEYCMYIGIIPKSQYLPKFTVR